MQIMKLSLVAYVWQYIDDFLSVLSFSPPHADKSRDTTVRSLLFLVTSAFLVAVIDAPDFVDKGMWSYIWASPRSHVLAALLFVGLQAGICKWSCRFMALRGAASGLVADYTYMYGALILTKAIIARTSAGTMEILQPVIGSMYQPEAAALSTLLFLGTAFVVDAIDVIVLLGLIFFLLRAARRLAETTNRVSPLRQATASAVVTAASVGAMLATTAFAMEIHSEEQELTLLGLPTKTYSILAASRWMTGLDSATDIENMRIRSVTSGRLEFGDETAALKYRDLWRLKAGLGEEGIVTIELTSSDFDPFIQLFSADGRLVGEDDDGGVGRNSRIAREITQGETLYLGVTSYLTSVTGDYELAVMSHVAVGTDVTGVLDSGSGAAPSGDLWRIDGELGAVVAAAVSSQDDNASFVPSIAVVDPDGYLVASGEVDASQEIAVELGDPGIYRLVVSSKVSGPGGRYKLTLRTVPDSGSTVAELQGATATSRTAIELDAVVVGTLEAGDLVKESKFVDEWEFNAQEERAVVAEVRSDEFDTYLRLLSLEGERRTLEESDDVGGDVGHSRIARTLMGSETYVIEVTSYGEGETGSYELALSRANPNLLANERRSAALADDDAEEGGKFRDYWRFEGERGQPFEVDVQSADFDTYVQLLSPSGVLIDENDDVNGDVGRSGVAATLREDGLHWVVVTSYGEGETGDYEVEVRRAQVGRLQIGISKKGELVDGDGVEHGKLRDLWRFSGGIGFSIRAEVTSEEFDTYLQLLSPGGELIDENDDADDGVRHSRIEAVLEEGGEYMVVVTTFGANEAGSYTVKVSAESEGM